MHWDVVISRDFATGFATGFTTAAVESLESPGSEVAVGLENTLCRLVWIFFLFLFFEDVTELKIRIISDDYKGKMASSPNVSVISSS